jgi:hypothetical protein
MMILTRSSYSAGHFELLIDGDRPTAYVKSVEGGWSNGNIADDSVGPDSQPVKQISSVNIDPITVEFGLGGAPDLLKWIAGSWDRTDNRRRTGQITHADFDMRSTFRHDFYDALITETTFPALDGASKESGYITCKLQPEWVETTALGKPGPQVWGNVSPHQKLWTPVAFRFSIDGIDDMQYVNKIDAFTVALQFQKFYTGQRGLPEIVPRNVKFPNITGTIALKYADKLIKWHNDYIGTKDGRGIKDPKAQTSGSIEYLAPNRQDVILRINMYDIGLMSLRVDKSMAGEEQIKRVKFELYVHRMEIDRSSIRNFGEFAVGTQSRHRAPNRGKSF